MPIGEHGLEGIGLEEIQETSIHIVDANWGTDGLRAMLAALTTDFDEPDRRAIAQAELLASRLHIRDMRSGDRPYVNHVLRVTIRIVHYYHVRNADVICAALLHDSVEDHPRGFAYLFTPAEREMDERSAALAVLGRVFGDRVATLIEAVTNPEFEAGLSLEERQEQYRIHVRESLEAEPWARVIKLSDFTDNGAGIDWTVAADKRKKLAKKYAPLVPNLIDFAQRHDTPLDPEVEAEIVEKLNAAAKRFERILRNDKNNGGGDGRG